jgi:hypothetical protein
MQSAQQKKKMLSAGYSGSMDMNEVSSVSSVSQSRGVSMENELRGSSISSDEGIPALATCSCSEGKAVTQQPIPTPSPRPERWVRPVIDLKKDNAGHGNWYRLF